MKIALTMKMSWERREKSLCRSIGDSEIFQRTGMLRIGPC
ncbi:hypothetical protein DBT_0694 [Dissulfuribacter thermophilus]|uniref:Uncharacterized protein n=1 Tax=Dissulfuribacter thermophilus TaxID=1156395 RepID=A0A1B9F746_9BACT|nr:hypothetical protein DBT_0694 [Dissulfuribacter thermophilus]